MIYSTYLTTCRQLDDPRYFLLYYQSVSATHRMIIVRNHSETSQPFNFKILLLIQDSDQEVVYVHRAQFCFDQIAFHSNGGRGRVGRNENVSGQASTAKLLVFRLISADYKRF